jgi:hypothetical protein
MAGDSAHDAATTIWASTVVFPVGGTEASTTVASGRVGPCWFGGLETGGVGAVCVGGVAGTSCTLC